MNQTDFKIGDVVGDMEVVGETYVVSKSGSRFFNKRKIVCNCIVCGREKTFQPLVLKRNVGTKHRMCNHEFTEETRAKYPGFYRCWAHIKARIDNPNIEHYERYGGRGLTNDYEYFVDFCDDLLDSYIKHMEEHGLQDTTIERIDNDLGYVKGNLRWATRKEQAVNRCTTIQWEIVDPDGNEYSTNNLKEFCENHGLNYRAANVAVKRNQPKYKGWAIRKAS